MRVRVRAISRGTPSKIFVTILRTYNPLSNPTTAPTPSTPNRLPTPLSPDSYLSLPSPASRFIHIPNRPIVARDRAGGTRCTATENHDLSQRRCQLLLGFTRGHGGVSRKEERSKTTRFVFRNRREEPCWVRNGKGWQSMWMWMKGCGAGADGDRG